MGGTQLVFCMVELTKIMVDCVIPKVNTQMHQVLNERDDLLLAVFSNKNNFHECYRLMVCS